MIELSGKELQKWKEIFAIDGIVYDTDNKYREAVNNLIGFFDVLIQMDQKQKITKNKEKQAHLKYCSGAKY